jgi:Trypsin-co-occurring domain 2
MPDNDKSSIGLAEFIQQVKEDLLSVAPGKEKDAPFLFVESVELELQVTVKRTGKAGAKGSVKINVLGIGGEIGAEAGGDISHDAVHKVKVKLSPLFDKDDLIKSYETQHPDKIRGTVKNSWTGLMKGDEESNLIDDLGE